LTRADLDVEQERVVKGGDEPLESILEDVARHGPPIVPT
jgi:hypothetical protein